MEDIHEAAAAYLAQDPARWLRLSQSVSRRLASSIEDSFSQTWPPVREESVLESAADALVEILLKPETVQIIASAGNQGQGHDLLVECIASEMRDLEVDLDDSAERNSWGDIVDMDTDDEWGPGVVRRGWANPDDYADAPAIPLRRILGVRLAREAVEEAVGESLRHMKKPMGGDEGASRSLIRLDVVDLALYKALSTHPELLRGLDWRTFERLLADILERFGYRVELQRGTKDGGVDIFALRSDEFGSHKYLLQAKRWSNRVTVEPVRQLLFLHSHHRVTKSCLATTSTFTRGAWSLAEQYRWQLDLRDADGIQEWISRAAGTIG